MFLKKEIHQRVIEIIRDKITNVQKDMHSQQEAANNETKSSAGDKYETGRAMAHFEQEKLSSQLQVNLNLEKLLAAIDPLKTSTLVESGAFVRTKTSAFYISIGIGAISLDSNTVFCISPSAPIAQVMLGLKVGDTFRFNKVDQKILSIN